MCYVTPASLGIPKQKGTKSDLWASHLPSRGPKRGRKCYVTPTFNAFGFPRTQKEVFKCLVLHHMHNAPPTLGSCKQCI